MKSYDTPKEERRTLVREDVDMSSTSTTLSPKSLTIPGIETLLMKLKEKENVGRWKVNKSYENEIRIELYDECHIMPKYTVVIDSVLEFSVFVFQWPIPDDHSIYRERKRSVKATHDIDKLLHFLENSCLCDGLPDIDEIKSVAVDPTAQVQSPGTVVRHSIPKLLSTEEAHFEVSVIFRCIDCLVIKETAQSHQQSCQPCVTVLNDIKRKN